MQNKIGFVIFCSIIIAIGFVQANIVYNNPTLPKLNSIIEVVSSGGGGGPTTNTSVIGLNRFESCKNTDECLVSVEAGDRIQVKAKGTTTGTATNRDMQLYINGILSDETTVSGGATTNIPYIVMNSSIANATGTLNVTIVQVGTSTVTDKLILVDIFRNQTISSGGGSSSNTTIIVNQTLDREAICWYRLDAVGSDTYYANGAGSAGDSTQGFNATHSGWITGLSHNSVGSGMASTDIIISARINGGANTLSLPANFASSTVVTLHNRTDVGTYPFNRGDLIQMFFDAPLILAINIDSGGCVEVTYNVTS